MIFITSYQYSFKPYISYRLNSLSKLLSFFTLQVTFEMRILPRLRGPLNLNKKVVLLICLGCAIHFLPYGRDEALEMVIQNRALLPHGGSPIERLKEIMSDEKTPGTTTPKSKIAGTNWRNLSKEEIGQLSVLARHLYLEEPLGAPKNKTFLILIWKKGLYMEPRFVNEFTSEKKDPFARCPVKNCRVTYEDANAKVADAILIHFHTTPGPHDFPNRTQASQRWIWLTDESPFHTFTLAGDKDISHYNGYFNWSMSYRMDSDIPVPYGRTLRLTEGEEPNNTVDYFSAKPKNVAIMGSNCVSHNRRWEYVKELQKYLEVDTYGGCGTLKCPGHFTRDCPALNQYKFYLAFENSNCPEYITEKVKTL